MQGCRIRRKTIARLPANRGAQSDPKRDSRAHRHADHSYKTRSVFDRYTMVSESDLRAGVDRLAAYVKKLPTETDREPLKKAESGGRKNDTDKKRTIARTPTVAFPAPAAKSMFLLTTWRRERDSNPRYPSGYSGFQDHRHRPLGHPSASKIRPESAR